MCNDEIITELLGIQGWKVKNIEVNNLNGNIKLELERREGIPYECVACGQFFTIIYDHCPARQIEDLPAWGHKTFIEFSQARVFCSDCGGVQPEKLEWVEAYQHQTVRYQRYLATLCDFMPVADVAELTGLSKDALYRIDKRYLKERRENHCKDHKVNYLGIDEIAVKKVCLVSGIADPDYFSFLVKEQGANISARYDFPDHYAYGQRDIDTINRKCKQQNIEAIITTAKDYVKIKELDISDIEDRLFIMNIGVDIVSGKESLNARLNSFNHS